jgi:hypothetical protein
MASGKESQPSLSAMPSGFSLHTVLSRLRMRDMTPSLLNASMRASTGSRSRQVRR